MKKGGHVELTPFQVVRVCKPIKKGTDVISDSIIWGSIGYHETREKAEVSGGLKKYRFSMLEEVKTDCGPKATKEEILTWLAEHHEFKPHKGYFLIIDHTRS